MIWPKISVVTPSFNQGEFLEETIDSVLSQNYQNLEYIIIDGGSTDGSVEIIKRHESHLHFWCTETDAGQYDGINKGFSHSTGDIMAWLNSDDMYCPWALRTVGSIMSSIPQVEWLSTLQPGLWDWHGFCAGFGSMPGYSRDAFLDGRHLPAGVPISIAVISPANCLRPLQQESTFWRRSLWDKVGSRVSTEFKLAGDFDLWARFYAHADLYGTASPLAGFRSQANQKTREIERYVKEAEQSLCRMRESFNWSPQFSRRVALKFSFPKIPKVRHFFEGMYRYHGKQIVRKDPSSPNGFWAVEEHKFY